MQDFPRKRNQSDCARTLSTGEVYAKNSYWYIGLCQCFDLLFARSKLVDFSDEVTNPPEILRPILNIFFLPCWSTSVRTFCPDWYLYSWNRSVGKRGLGSSVPKYLIPTHKVSVQCTVNGNRMSHSQNEHFTWRFVTFRIPQILTSKCRKKHFRLPILKFSGKHASRLP